jgi:hypothetical protein
MKKFLKENFQIKSKITFLFLMIGVIILIFFLNFVYKNYKRNYLIQETRKRKIEMEKEQLKREEESEKSNKKIEDEFLFFEQYFKSFTKIAEKINNFGNPGEIRAKIYFILDSKYSFAKNAIYSDKFIYIKADRIKKYTLSNGKKFYVFENAEVKSKKTHRTINKSYDAYIMNGNLYCTIDYNGNLVESMTTKYTNPESARSIQDDKKFEAMKEEAKWLEMNKYLPLRRNMEDRAEKKFINNTTGNHYPNVLSKKELEKLDKEENERERAESDESEFEDREEREYWESEEYWDDEGIEKDVY